MKLLLLAIIFFHSSLIGEDVIQKKILICGVCKDVAPAVQNTIKNIELLGCRFADYKAIIYENNSSDGTNMLFKRWADENKHAVFMSEHIPGKKLAPSRTERIAVSRNKILSLVKSPAYEEYDFVIFVDLDFTTPWPIEVICQTIETEGDWDCVAANGLHANGFYYDRYAYRGKDYPFGPEVLGIWWWDEVNSDRRIRLDLEAPWVPVYSAFGGLAIYKRNSLLDVSYSGTVTDDLKKYYNSIVKDILKEHHHLVKYRSLNAFHKDFDLIEHSILTRRNSEWESPENYGGVTCCEHIPFHASMSLQGHGKIYINPKMVMQY